MKPFTAPMPEFAAGPTRQAGLGVPPDESPRRRSWLLPPEPSSVREARRIVRTQLAQWALHEQIDDTELLVSELVTNALCHAWGPVRLTFCRPSRHPGIRCEIEDANPSGPTRRQAREHEEEGRGLYMLTLLSRSWGSDRTSAGKVVWFELHARVGSG
ncbi:ATP-binding protein [Streptomyces sp. NBC_01210]|uniref:ATP-binding protein n=1 Tax=Streptomyces sp. NBC_01210 TaxID=2903774 RepID=UPI002E0D3CBA|nr:ATP-binding protein [Streptomyces sp. NBC_01210]